MPKSWKKWLLSEGLSLSVGNKRLNFIHFKTLEEKAKGLMFRKEPLGPNLGALFSYDKPEPLSFWMKNTFIPLDIVFLDENGVVSDVYSGVQPHSEDPVKSSKPCKWAIELDEGQATLLGLLPGKSIFQ